MLLQGVYTPFPKTFGTRMLHAHAPAFYAPEERERIPAGLPDEPGRIPPWNPKLGLGHQTR